MTHPFSKSNTKLENKTKRVFHLIVNKVICEAAFQSIYLSLATMKIFVPGNSLERA